ncbi:MAG: hypothetical protein AB7S44_04160 [Spirochaetales bacterium]
MDRKFNNPYIKLSFLSNDRLLSQVIDSSVDNAHFTKILKLMDDSYTAWWLSDDPKVIAEKQLELDDLIVYKSTLRDAISIVLNRDDITIDMFNDDYEWAKLGRQVKMTLHPKMKDKLMQEQRIADREHSKQTFSDNERHPSEKKGVTHEVEDPSIIHI